MLYLVLVLILIAAASVATIYVIGEPGYIFLQWGSWQVETSLILVVTFTFLVVLLLYVLVELIGGIVGIPSRVGKSYREYREQKKLITTAKGFRHLLMGDWAKAEKLLEGAAKHLPEAAINHLAAAYAAQKRGNLGERDAYLIKAKEQGQEYQHVVSLVTCRLQMDQNEYPSAIEELKKLCSALPNNAAAFRTLAEAYQKIDDWTSLDQLLPHLQKSQAYSSKEFRMLSSRVLRHRLQLVDSSSELLAIWKRSSNHVQNESELSAVYVRKLLEFDRHEEAEKVIRRVLDRTWNSDLAYLYGLIGGDMDSRRLYDTAVKWTKLHPEDADMLLTAGKLANRNSLWGKAQGYLELSIQHGGRREAFEELGRLLENQGDAEKAFDVYKKATLKSGR